MCKWEWEQESNRGEREDSQKEDYEGEIERGRPRERGRERSDDRLFFTFPLLTADVISHSPRTHSRSNLRLLWTALLKPHNQMKTFITYTLHRLHTHSQKIEPTTPYTLYHCTQNERRNITVTLLHTLSHTDIWCNKIYLQIQLYAAQTSDMLLTAPGDGLSCLVTSNLPVCVWDHNKWTFNSLSVNLSGFIAVHKAVCVPKRQTHIHTGTLHAETPLGSRIRQAIKIKAPQKISTVSSKLFFLPFFPPCFDSFSPFSSSL